MLFQQYNVELRRPHKRSARRPSKTRHRPTFQQSHRSMTLLRARPSVDIFAGSHIGGHRCHAVRFRHPVFTYRYAGHNLRRSRQYRVLRPRCCMEGVTQPVRCITRALTGACPESRLLRAGAFGIREGDRPCKNRNAPLFPGRSKHALCSVEDLAPMSPSMI